jgi:hypothetical protein
VRLQWKLDGGGVSSCSDAVPRQFVRIEAVGIVVRVARPGNADSGRAPFVAMMEAADLWDRHDVAIARRDRTGNGRVFVERQVRAGPLVIRTIAHHQPLQARFAKHDHVIETLATSGSNESFDERILKVQAAP